jgi:hypothetical protein
VNPVLKEIILDPDLVVKDPRHDSIKWLEKRKANGMMERELTDYTDHELYAFKDRLKARRIVGRGPDQAQARYYKKTMLRKINAELRRRKLPGTRPDDRRCYGSGQEPWQQAMGAAK